MTQLRKLINAVEVVVAAGIAALLLFVVFPTMAVSHPPPCYTDFTHECRYCVTGLADDGFFIEARGPPHCRDRIHVDGVPIVAERKT